MCYDFSFVNEFVCFTHNNAGAVNLYPPTISVCPDGEDVTLTCSISEQSAMTWIVTVPNNNPGMFALVSTAQVSSGTIDINGVIFFIERMSSRPFVVTLSLNASLSLNGTMISCSDGTDMETVTVSITGITV